MKLIFMTIFLILGFFSFTQTYSFQISDSTILNFMEWEIKNGEKFREDKKKRAYRKADIEIIPFDSINFILPDSVHWSDWQYDLYLFNRFNKLDSILSEKEQPYLIEQFNSVKETVWSHKIRGAKFKKWKNLKYTYFYSIPLFSSDEKYVLIRKSFYCGNICGYGGIYLYRKTANNSWEIVRILNGWIS